MSPGVRQNHLRCRSSTPSLPGSIRAEAKGRGEGPGSAPRCCERCTASSSWLRALVAQVRLEDWHPDPKELRRPEDHPGVDCE